MPKPPRLRGREGERKYKNGRGGFTVMLPPTFQGKICPPFDRLPYFVPLTTASSIWTYSVVRVPYRLLLAAVFSHLPIGGSYPTDLYYWDNPKPACAATSEQWIKFT